MADERAQLIGKVDREKATALKHRLLDDGLTFRDWLERQIDRYLASTPKRRTKP